MDPVSQNPKTPCGNRKPPIALVPATALLEQARAHKLGADKYGAYNWRTVPAVEAMVYINAAMRHLLSYLDGEDIDPESKAPHLAHVCACCNILMDAKAVKNLFDDRPKKTNTAQMIRKYSEKGKEDAKQRK